MPLKKAGLLFSLALLLSGKSAAGPLQLEARPVSLKNGKSFKLQVLRGFGVRPAFEGLDRPRFMSKSPDGRLFVAEMHNMSDNKVGKISILTGFDPKTGKFSGKTSYLENLRNPNNAAFYTDKKGRTWITV